MLSRWQSTIVDAQGNVQPLANLTVRNEADQSLAKMWASPGTSQPLPDGMVQADGNGYAFFYARGGLYRITSAALGIDWRAVQIGAALVSIGDYGPGLEITARNQIFWRDGELYRAGASLELPYTTTGDWGVEEGLFVAVGDQVLRQELTNPQGSALAGWGVVAVDSVYALSSISAENRREDLAYVIRGFHPGSKVGGGSFFYDTGVNRSAHNGGTIISPTVPSVMEQPGSSLSERTLSYLEGNGDTEPNGFGCFVRILNGFINAEDFGVFDSGVEVQGAALNIGLSAAAEQNVAFKTASVLNVETDVSIVVPVDGIVDAPQLRIRERDWGAIDVPIVMALSGASIKGVTIVGSTAEMAVSARGSSNVTVSDCDISGSLIGIDFRHVNISTNIFIQNNDINVKVFGIIFNNSEDCTIIENRITSESPNAGGCIESVTGPSSRIKIVRNTLTETRVGVNLLDATRCLVTENYTNGVTGLQFRNTSHCVVSNNVVEDVKDLGINFDRVNKHNVVVGNTMKNCGQAGIGLTADVGEPTLPTENSYFTITGNTVTDSTALSGFPTSTGAGIIAITFGLNNVISANTLHGNERFGIRISSGLQNTIIDGNQCIGNETGIQVETDNITISSNVVRNNSTVGIRTTRNNAILSGNTASNNGIGIQLSDQSRNCLVVGNMSLNNTTSNYTNIQGLSGCKGRGNHGIEDFG